MTDVYTDVYILSAVRTPIGKFGGSLASITASDMGVVAAKAKLELAKRVRDTHRNGGDGETRLRLC